MAEAKLVRESLEAGRAYISPPPEITMWSENYPKLEDKIVGDTVSLEVTGRVTSYDEDGRYRLELSDIKIVEKTAKEKLIEKAQSEIVNIGSLSPESLNAIFSASKKKKED